MCSVAAPIINKIGVFDDFLSDPEGYRRWAIQRDFRSFEFEHCTFHGIAPVSNDSIIPEKVGRSLGQQVSLSFLRQSPLGQEEPNYIHTDIDMGDWTAILYLNPDPPYNDGTNFWRHVGSGEIGSRIPHERSAEGHTGQGWELSSFVQAKFNRLLVFPSHLFHSRAIHENWGEGDDARLTHVTFGRFE